ncbi:metabotropic glutamate receptor 3-like isoform X1 [Acanthaster planci]|uniref:Metabotropic glutamate receptor 3-like isoform X1 n=1 Tax=Acanthaster planci TaxID=133434 RepID=A0A8B7XQ43_ACAPL|nr:metabotropic glutamate receptor 3-like isoform X1 [Acanthaster planci]
MALRGVVTATRLSGPPRALPAILVIVLLVDQVAQVGTYSGIHYTCRGDLNLGGLVPLHKYDETNQQCGPLRTIGALKRLEAMVFAVDTINRNSSLLPGIDLGFEIYDTCSSNAVTLRDCLNFIPPQRWDGNCSLLRSEELCPDTEPPIVGVVGAQRSGSSVQAAILLGLYHIPQVSYLSTSDELSNVLRYPYFLRTVGPDSYQVEAIADLIEEYGWNYVSFINSDDTYGKSAQQAFRTTAQKLGVCIAITRTVSLYATDETFDDLVVELLTLQTSSHAVVVILFVQLEMAEDIFRAATKAEANRRFIWIGSDGWGNYGDDAVKDYLNATVGAFTLSPLSKRLNEFDDYFHSLNTSSRNPWLREFLEEYTDCSTNGTGAPSCDDPGLISLADDGKVAHETLVMDSVFTFAHALESMRRDLCPNTEQGLCPNMAAIDGDVLHQHLLNTEFQSLANGWISFTKEGNMYGRYAVNHLQMNKTSGEYSFHRVGEWKQSTDKDVPSLKIDPGLPWYLWDGASVDPSTGIPRSVCSNPCKPGEKINRIPDNLCCWTCTACETSEIVVENGTKCQSCIDVDEGKFAWPNADQTVCVDIPNDFVLGEQAWAIAIITVACVCILATLFVLAVYIHNQEMPLIKASSRELSYIIFVGILLSYVTAIVFSIAPSTFVCILRRFGPSIAPSLIYASIATKTIRLFRIFRASKKSAKRPNYIGSMFQVVLSLSVSSLAVVWTVVWLIVDPPSVILKLPNERENILQVTCLMNIVETVGVMVWNVALIIVCCVFAFMTRKLPENYNETRFITFCSFCTLVVYVTFSPIYFTSKEPYYQASYYSAGLIINATVTLTCLFAVKIYALYFVDEDEMNIFTQTRLRANTKTSSARGLQFQTSSSGHTEVHSNPNYVSETGTYLPAAPGGESTNDVNLNEAREDRLRSSSDNSNKSSNSSKASSAGGVMDRLRGTNKVDPSNSRQGSRDTARPNGITSLDKVVRGPGKPSPSVKETKVFFSPDVVECDTHM